MKRAAIDWREVVGYAVVSLGGLLLALWGMNAWGADLRVPIQYSSDALLNGALIKGSIEHGWLQVNPSLGLPGQLNMGDFPIAEVLMFGLVKLISAFARDWALSLNLFFLMTFPLTAGLSLWVMRRLGISMLPAGALSLLYTLLPYHFIRAESHMALAAYFLVPPMVLVILWSMADEPLLFSKRSSSPWRLDLKRPEPIIALVVCVLVGLGGIYYAFFACFFLLVAGAIAAARAGRWQLLVSALLLVAVIAVTGVLALSPSIIYHRTNGSNAAATIRNPGQAEIYALKFDELLLPVDGHRIPVFARIKQLYHTGQAQMGKWLDNEAVTTTPLGLVGVLGLVIALMWPFLGEPAARWAGRDRAPLLKRIGQLAILGLLLGTVGGFGAVFAFVLPQIRAYNRVLVFLAYFAALALALVLDRMLSKAKPGVRRGLVLGAIAGLLLIGVFDQVPPGFAPDYGAAKAAYAADAAFVSRVENALPPGAAVLQLPYMPFPEPGGPLVKMTDYEPFRGYLHSKALRWSYGAQKGREIDAWQQQVASLPAAALIAEAQRAGFSAVWVDRNGYADNGAAIEAALAQATGVTPIVSDDGQLSVFVLKAR
jgi:phosphoglycerol transferase